MGQNEIDVIGAHLARMATPATEAEQAAMHDKLIAKMQEIERSIAPDPRITTLQAENEKLRELLGECDWLLKWANEHLMAFSNMRLETEFFSRREHAIERIQAALEPKP